MRCFKTISNEFIISVGTGNGGVQITTEEYLVIVDTIRNKPTPPEGFDYRLKADLSWEQYELPAADPDPELTAEEALAIIVGGDTDA